MKRKNRERYEAQVPNMQPGNPRKRFMQVHDKDAKGCITIRQAFKSHSFQGKWKFFDCGAVFVVALKDNHPHPPSDIYAFANDVWYEWDGNPPDDRWMVADYSKRVSYAKEWLDCGLVTTQVDLDAFEILCESGLAAMLRHRVTGEAPEQKQDAQYTWATLNSPFIITKPKP